MPLLRVAPAYYAANRDGEIHPLPASSAEALMRGRRAEVAAEWLAAPGVVFVAEVGILAVDEGPVAVLSAGIAARKAAPSFPDLGPFEFPLWVAEPLASEIYSTTPRARNLGGLRRFLRGTLKVQVIPYFLRLQLNGIRGSTEPLFWDMGMAAFDGDLELEGWSLISGRRIPPYSEWCCYSGEGCCHPQPKRPSPRARASDRQTAGD
jgi:hypothetical protein